MTPTEAVLLTRYVKACCPQQQIDEYTPDAWFDVLGDLELSGCKAAVAAITRKQPFVAPSEIRTHVMAVRGDDGGPQSNACRARNCRDCVWSWCVHQCHVAGVTAQPGALAIEGS
jgi:hypothetical protein